METGANTPPRKPLAFRHRFRLFLKEALPTRCDHFVLGLLLVSALLLTKAETLILPAGLGLRAAGALVDKEAELARTRQRIAEYQAAMEYFGRPVGKEFARRLLFDESRKDERRAELRPLAPPAPHGPIATVGGWLGRFHQRATALGRRAVAVGNRLLHDPPPPAESQAPRVGETTAREVLREQVRRSADLPAAPAGG